MGGLFNPDNTFFRGMSKLWDMLFVSILWAICCIPGYFLITLVTSSLSNPIQIFMYMAIDALCMVPIGPAMAAIYYVCMKVIRRDRGYVFHEYVHAFKLNFKVGAAAGAVLGAAVTLLSFNLQYSYAAVTASEEKDMMGRVLLVVTLAICFVLLGTLMFLFPVLSRFTMGVKQLFKTSMYMAFRHILHTLAILVVVVLSAVVMYVVLPALFFMPAACALLSSFLIEHVFKRYMPKPEKTVETDGTIVTEGDVVSEGEDGERRDLWYLE
ncbi:MAG: DUF624 domain-containing protein [Lachnospiraceae bacterium]|nr:DUF624 domain-containing protein [Lachnospiraceae bacterium]